MMSVKQDKDRAADAPSGRGLPRLDQHICFALYSASGVVTQLYRPLLEPLGLTYPQYLVMLSVWEKSPRTVGEISAALGLEPATLTPVLKRLEANGLLTRRRDAMDERRVLVQPTAKGTALRAHVEDVPYKMLCQLPLDGDDITQLRTILGKIVDAGRALESADG